ncbi:MAG TPA: M23 family metallopeptidase [Opitutus sp.]|nr:M23 family metallopeptidase [Opitutus sp.]
MLRSLPRIRFLTLVSLCFTVFARGQADSSVQVIAREIGGSVHLFAQVKDGMDITLTLQIDQTNLRASHVLPSTFDLSGQRSAELVVLTPINPDEPWDYAYRYHWRYGGREGSPDPNAVYVLPYLSSQHHRLDQGSHGRVSHGPGSDNAHAFDFKMPIGTTICAARGGTVTAVRTDSKLGGPNPALKSAGNYIVIRHRDGTYAEYVHIEHDGGLVKVGEVVEAGQPIALSGNTGFSTGPHLHFAVFRTQDGFKRETLPVRFASNGRLLAMMEGDVY